MPPAQLTFARDGGRCVSCGLHAQLLFLGACAAPAGCGVPPSRPRALRKWASNAALKAALKAEAAATGAAWRASEGGKPKARGALLADAARAAAAHVQRHAWPPAVAAALAAADPDAGAPPELLADSGGYSDGEEGTASDAEALDAPPADAASHAEQSRLATRLGDWLRGNGFHTAARASALRAGDFWQADHETPVAEGGGACSLDNLRTLCTPCHAAETRQLAARRAVSRRRAKAGGAEDVDAAEEAAVVAIGAMPRAPPEAGAPPPPRVKGGRYKTRKPKR